MDGLLAPTMSDPSPAGFRGLAFVARSTSFLDQLTEFRVVPLLRPKAARDNAANLCRLTAPLGLWEH